MSYFLVNNAAPVPQLGGVGGSIYRTDDRLSMQIDQWAFCPYPRMQEAWGNGNLWVNSRGLGGQFSNYGMLGDDGTLYGGHWEPDLLWGWDADGGAKQNIFTGLTRDQNGNLLGSSVVMAYVTSSNAYVGQVTSDSSGYYRLPTPFGTGVTHYLVAFKSGSPDVAGTTDNTLTPSATG